MPPASVFRHPSSQSGAGAIRYRTALPARCPASSASHKDSSALCPASPEPEFLNFYGAQEWIPRNQFSQAAWPGGPVRQTYSYSVPSPLRLFKIPEPVFVDLLRRLGIDSHPGGPVRNPICRTGPPGYIGWRNRFQGIDSWAPYTFTKYGLCTAHCPDSLALYKDSSALCPTSTDRWTFYTFPWNFVFL